MKVCFLAGTLGRGGAERQLTFMLKALNEAGVESRLLCLTRGEAYENVVEKMGIDVRWVGASSNKILRLREVVKAVREYSPDVLQSSHFFTNIYVAAAGRYCKVANIGAIRSNVTSEIAANGLYGRWQLRMPQHLIANSQISVKKAVSLGVSENKIDFVPNIVETFEGQVPYRSGNGPAVTVLFAGRLVPVKRPDQFIALAARLRRDISDVQLKFRIAGDGPLREDLERLAESSGLSRDCLTFMGEQSEMSRVYDSSDMLVLTSEYEGCPNVALEAMAHGLPVIATRVGGVPEVVGDGRGILVDLDDAEGLVSAARKLILEPILRKSLGKNGRAYITRGRSLGFLKDRLIEIYRKLI
jgi:glycosyltransferase involved in cell wall biosynthesis